MDFEKSLSNLCWELVIEEAFYGLFLTELNKRFVDDKNMPTACVSKAPDSINVSLLINKTFWKDQLQNDKQRKYIILHETLHVIFNHFLFRDVRPDHLIDNIAADICINQYCDAKYERPQEKNPKTGKFEDMGMHIDKFPELKLKPLESTQYYYDELLKAKQKKENSEGKQDSKAGPKGNKRGTSGSELLDQMLDNQPVDWHASWEELTEGMSEMEKKLLEKQIAASIKEVAEQVEKSRGEIPAHLQDIVRRALEVKQPVVSWKQLFKQFVGSCMAYDPYRTRKRPNHRFEDAPVIKNKPKARGIFMPDQSGSMGEQEIAECNSELYHIWKAGVKIEVAEWDADVVDHPWEYKGKLEYQRVKGGGTRMSCATEWANKHTKDYDFCIIMSDGYVEDTITDCKIPTLIIVTSNGATNFKTKHKVLRMN